VQSITAKHRSQSFCFTWLTLWLQICQTRNRKKWQIFRTLQIPPPTPPSPSPSLLLLLFLFLFFFFYSSSFSSFSSSFFSFSSSTFTLFLFFSFSFSFSFLFFSFLFFFYFFLDGTKLHFVSSSLMDFSCSAVFFDPDFQFVILYLVISACTQFHQLFFVVPLVDFHEDYC